ncbi:MAG: hypothetical protein QNK23_08300 [Crocinitomicaceae bacterium]|nr:hypothetical protein [Crocinitomicaceae bacterium]
MRNLIFLFLLISPVSFSQIISGPVKDEGRKMVTVTDYTIAGMVDGYAIYELAVDREGNVTSARLLETDLKSTPAKHKMQNHVMKLIFQKGTYFPKFHHAVVKFTMIKE